MTDKIKNFLLEMYRNAGQNRITILKTELSSREDKETPDAGLKHELQMRMESS